MYKALIVRHSYLTIGTPAASSMEPPAAPSTYSADIGAAWYVMWTCLGFVGAGIALGIRVSRGEVVNKWAVGTAFIAGMSMAGTSTNAMVNLAHLPAGLSGAVALLLGVMAMGFIADAMDGKISLINKFIGGGPKS